jgi:VCBS repeat-containing protein
VADDSYTTPEDTTLTVVAPGVLANDSDVDGDVLTSILVTGPAHGVLTLNTNGSFTYTPVLNYNGPDSFTYKANDGQADSPTNAVVSITVTPVNDPPGTSGAIVADDSYTTPEDTTLTVVAPGVLGNDGDVDGDALTAILVVGPTNGVLTLNTNGSFTYTPVLNYNGPDSFAYKANDGLADSPTNAIVSITVTPVNDPPGTSGAIVADDSYTTPEDTTLTVVAPGVLGNDGDVDGDPLTAILVVGPTNGVLTLNTNGSFTYTPVLNYNGPDSFTYKANDGLADSPTNAIVSITVTPVNDPPVALNNNYNTAEDTALNVVVPGVLGNDTDVDGDTLSAILVSPPTNGVLTLNTNGSFSYLPSLDYLGSDTFTYMANDGLADSPTNAVVSITVTPVNDPPGTSGAIVADDSYTTPEDTTLTVALRACWPTTAMWMAIR